MGRESAGSADALPVSSVQLIAKAGTDLMRVDVFNGRVFRYRLVVVSGVDLASRNFADVEEAIADVEEEAAARVDDDRRILEAALNSFLSAANFECEARHRRRGDVRARAAFDFANDATARKKAQT